MTVQRADLMAMVDVVKQLTEETDGLEREELAGLLDALDELRRTMGMCRSLLVTRGIGLLKNPVIIGSRMYVTKDKTVRRDHHHDIAEQVIDWALVDRMTGQVITDPKHAVNRAVEKMLAIYVSPSTQAKKTALHQMVGGEQADQLVEEKKVEGETVEVIQLRGD